MDKNKLRVFILAKQTMHSKDLEVGSVVYESPVVVPETYPKGYVSVTRSPNEDDTGGIYYIPLDCLNQTFPTIGANELEKMIENEPSNDFGSLFGAVNPSDSFMSKVKKLIDENFPYKPQKKKYPSMIVKQDMKKDTTHGLPFDMPKGTVFNLNDMPTAIADAIMQTFGAVLKTENPFVELVDQDSKQPPPKLSDAIIEGSKDSPQAIGEYFGVGPPPVFPMAPEPVLTSSPLFKKHFVYPKQYYSSFMIGGWASNPGHVNKSLFTSGVGQEGQTYADTNMMISGGIMPLSKKFKCQSVYVCTTSPMTPGLRRWLAGTVLSVRTPMMEDRIGTLGMAYLHDPWDGMQGIPLKLNLEGGMDFRFTVEWEKDVMEELQDELNPPYMRFGLAKWIYKTIMNRPWKPKSIQVWVVMRGREEKPGF